MIGMCVGFGGCRRLPHPYLAAFRLPVPRLPVPHDFGDATRGWGWEFVGAVPKVGLRASGQPWALGRNPVGIGRALAGGRRLRRRMGRHEMGRREMMVSVGSEREDRVVGAVGTDGTDTSQRTEM